MLKRCQTLHENWQLQYAKKVGKKHGFSFSKFLRLALAEYILSGRDDRIPEDAEDYFDNIMFKARTKAGNK